jgi:hypothetical protein
VNTGNEVLRDFLNDLLTAYLKIQEMMPPDSSMLFHPFIPGGICKKTVELIIILI